MRNAQLSSNDLFALLFRQLVLVPAVWLWQFALVVPPRTFIVSVINISSFALACLMCGLPQYAMPRILPQPCSLVINVPSRGPCDHPVHRVVCSCKAQAGNLSFWCMRKMDPIDTQHEGNGTGAQDHTVHGPIAAQTIEELTNQV